jgi:DNA polymerase-3 subunit alpha
MRDRYEARLQFELGVINSMGFPGYFLIVMEFIQWAKDHDIPVGPGRGSGAGSLVAYVLKITDVDPLEYDLLFERFLNPERVSLPDFDIDFCMDGRDRVIQHVTERYGAGAVSQIITFGTMAAKAVVRDVARVQGKAYGLADKLSKLIPFEPGMTLHKALEQEPLLGEFIDSSEEAQEIMDMAFSLEGLSRNVGRHAGGVVIAPTVLTDFSPTYRDSPESGLMTQFDMTDVEQAGLVKFDFLGLRTLTIIDQAVKSINARHAATGDPLVDINALELEDPAIYQDLQAARTTAVFQLESRGMKDLMKRVKPSRFADIVALVALFRPGPLQLADDFIRRKHGLDEVDYLHPSLQPVLADTYGVMLYQEQVMQIAQILAGYSLADADLLRRAMGKKKPEEMAKQREVFVAGALRNEVDERKAGHIFDLMEKFAGYGFNKPHSVCYALLAYQTAWLKHYHPADFMAAVMSADMQNTDKIVINIEESRELGLEIAPPDVNVGAYRFVASRPGTVVYGLGAIKGLGEGAIQNLVDERLASGVYTDLFDLCRRVDTRRLNKRALEALVGAGALDSLVNQSAIAAMSDADARDQKRAHLDAYLDQAVQVAEQESRNAETGLSDLFGDIQSGAQDVASFKVDAKVQPLSMQKRLTREKEALGLYLTGHPIDVYRNEMRHLAGTRISDLRPRDGEQRFAGWVIGLRSLKTQRGSIVFVTLDDRSGRIEVSVANDVLDRHRDKLVKDTLIIVSGQVAQDEYSGGVRVRANQLMTLTEARGRAIQGVCLQLSAEGFDDQWTDQLAALLKSHQGDPAALCPIFIEYEAKTVGARLRLGDAWRVVPNDDLIADLRQRFGRDHVRLDYDWSSAAS